MTGPGAPLISVVLPVGNVADFLPACLDSVFGEPGQPGGDLEVIAVDDASSDGCGHILDTRAYSRDCEFLFGRFLHHFPYFGMRGDADRAALDRTFRE